MKGFRIFAIVVGILFTGCASMDGYSDGIDNESRIRRATNALGGGRFDEASRDLRFLAERCETGAVGREAVLVLASHELDPRNPGRLPQAAAQLAARYLQESSASPSSLRLAESLYLLALDLGADPVEDPFASIPTSGIETPGEGAEGSDSGAEGESETPWMVAFRFQDCDLAIRPGVERMPPRFSGRSLREELEGLTKERKELLRRVDVLESELRWLREPMGEGEASLYAHLAHLAGERDALRSRVELLESELERIRSLIRSAPQRPEPASEDP